MVNNDELRAVWTASEDLGSYGALVQLLLLTGQRLRKVATMRWDDVVDGTWNMVSDDRERAMRLGQIRKDLARGIFRSALYPSVDCSTHAVLARSSSRVP